MSTSHSTNLDGHGKEESSRPKKRRKIQQDPTPVPVIDTTSPGGGRSGPTRQFVSPPNTLVSIVESEELQGIDNQMIREREASKCLDLAHQNILLPTNQEDPQNTNHHVSLPSQSLSSADRIYSDLTKFITASLEAIPSVMDGSTNQVLGNPHLYRQLHDSLSRPPVLWGDTSGVGTTSTYPNNAQPSTNPQRSARLPTVTNPRQTTNTDQKYGRNITHGKQRRVGAQGSSQMRVERPLVDIRHDPLRYTTRQRRTGSSQVECSISISRIGRLQRNSQQLPRPATLAPQNLVYLPKYHPLHNSSGLPYHDIPSSSVATPDLVEHPNFSVGVPEADLTSPPAELILLNEIQEAIGKCINDWYIVALDRCNQLSSDSNATAKIQPTLKILEERLQTPPTKFPDGMLLLLKKLLEHVRPNGNQALEELSLWLRHYIGNDGYSIASACQELLKDLDNGKRFLKIVYESPGVTTPSTSTAKTKANQASSSTAARRSPHSPQYLLLRRRLSEENTPSRRGQKGKALGTKVLRCGGSDCQNCSKDSWETRQKIWRHLSPKYLKGKQAWMCPIWYARLL
jgi:hypothetical protein